MIASVLIALGTTQVVVFVVEGIARDHDPTVVLALLSAVPLGLIAFGTWRGRMVGCVFAVIYSAILVLSGLVAFSDGANSTGAEETRAVLQMAYGAAILILLLAWRGGRVYFIRRR